VCPRAAHSERLIAELRPTYPLDQWIGDKYRLLIVRGLYSGGWREVNKKEGPFQLSADSWRHRKTRGSAPLSKQELAPR
jgi:hypothetical protein